MFDHIEDEAQRAALIKAFLEGSGVPGGDPALKVVKAGLVETADARRAQELASSRALFLADQAAAANAPERAIANGQVSGGSTVKDAWLAEASPEAIGAFLRNFGVPGADPDLAALKEETRLKGGPPTPAAPEPFTPEDAL